MLSECVGANIKKYREKKGWKQEKLAFTIGVTRQYVSLIEYGKINIGVNTLAAIAVALDIDLLELLDGYEATT